MNPDDQKPHSDAPADAPQTNDTPADTSAPVSPAAPEPTTPEVFTSEVPVTPVTPVTSPVDATTPAAPSDQPAATPVTPYVATAGAPKKPGNKKLLVIIGSVVGALLLIAAAVVAYFAFTSVSKEDYQAAASQLREVKDANSKLLTETSKLSRSTATATDETFSNNLSAARDSLDSIKDKNTELAKLKAVRVGKGAEHYKAFDDKLKAYIQYGDDLIVSVEKYRPAWVVCQKTSGASANIDERAKTLRNCATALNGVESVPNEEFGTFLKGLSENYGEYATIYEQISKLNPTSQYAEFNQLRNKATTVQNDIRKLTNDFLDALQKRDKEMSVESTYNTLQDYLREQQK